MNWKEYEIYITRHFQKLFPNASIKHNVKRFGIISKIERQIDILVEDTVAGFTISIIIDCKYFSKKVDVKDVESFLSFLLDLKASKGIMITNVGYSKAAYNRATYDTQDVELRIINFEDLDLFQGFLAIPYSGGHCAVVSAPNGWVIDNNPKGPYLASIYPAGLTQEEAFHTDGFMYLLFSHKDKKLPDLQSLLKLQEEGINRKYRKPLYEYIPTITRDDCNTILRILEAEEIPNTVDCTLFLDFPEVILFITLLSPKNKLSDYLKKLEWVGIKLIKGQVIHAVNGEPLSIFNQQEKAEPKGPPDGLRRR